MSRSRLGWLRAACTFAALGGCNQVFGIEDTELVMELDTDDDGRIDFEDNCPTTANEDQRDFDLDEVGDACDNCPLYANTPQQNAGEPAGARDEIGDACDPNPTASGDCLILIDRFSDPTRLAADWELVYGASEPAPTLQHAGDHVVFEPNGTNTPAFMVARLDGARLIGRFSVTVVGDWSPSSNYAEAMAAADVTSVDSYVACGIQKIDPVDPSTYVRFQVGTLSQIQAGFMSGPPVGSEFLIRHVVERDTMDVARCSVKWGVADGVTNTANGLTPLPAGGAGVVGKNDPLAIRALALYETRSSCPATIIR